MLDEEKKAYIYKIINKVNGKFYIGSTNNYKRRWYRHKHELKHNSHGNAYLQNAWNKYGEENFEFKVIEECSRADKFKREQHYLDLYKPFNHEGYNICPNASGGIPGLESPNCIYTEKQIIKVKQMLCDRVPYVYIEELTGINTSTIHTIAYLTNWMDIGVKYNKKLYDIYNEQGKISEPKLTEDMVKQAYYLKENNIPMRDIYYVLRIQKGILKQPLIIYEAKMQGKKIKKCEICGKEMIIKNNCQKYCKECSSKKKNNKQIYKSKKVKKQDNEIKKDKVTKDCKNSKTYMGIKSYKNILIEDNKDKIIQLYNNGCSLSKIASVIKTDSTCITNKNIELKLKEWGIYDINKKQNNSRFHDNNISYIGVYTTKYILIKVFKFKWQCRDWILENKIALTESQAKNYISQSINHNKIFNGYIFKNITKSQYDEYKLNNK